MEPYDLILSLLGNLSEQEVNGLRDKLQVRVSSCMKNGHKYKNIGQIYTPNWFWPDWFWAPDVQTKLYCEKCGHILHV